MNDRRKLREVAKMLNARTEDVPKVLEKFRKEIEEMEKDLRGKV